MDSGDPAGRQTKLCITVKKEENFSEWYTEVVLKGELIAYSDVSGCYICMPQSTAIWEEIHSVLNRKIKRLGVKNCIFPLFITKKALEKEKNHIEGFSPEVAWVTRAGDSELAEPLAIRPTSEAAMYGHFSKWIRSRYDLPLRLNQWNNVVRWEFKDPTPFIRSREFNWQEGHSAFETRDEALQEVEQILEFYASVYEDLLAVPVVRGRKSEKEKFAGAEFTLTVEGYISGNGRGIQAATSHHLGQNFSKMFEISVPTTDDSTSEEKKFVYQNSWGLSTRSIGVVVMTHSDNKGLVLPPRVSPTQVVVIPVGITVTTSSDVKERIHAACKEVYADLQKAGIRAKLDNSDRHTPGRKFNHWELRGACLRLELGPKDLEQAQVTSCRRDTGEKVSISRDRLAEGIARQLEEMQAALYAKAKREMDDHKFQVTSWEEFLEKLNAKCILIAPFCGRPACEDIIKKDSASDNLMGAKSLCIPHEQPEDPFVRCIHPGCAEKPKYWTLFGRSY